MSAFIVDTDCMDRVVSAIIAPPHREFAGILTGLPDAGTKIGQMLYDLNEIAMDERYEDRWHDDDEAMNRWSINYEHTPVSGGISVQSVKSMQCLIYQCSEGNVPKMKPYQELEIACGRVAQRVVEELPAYDKAIWG